MEEKLKLLRENRLDLSAETEQVQKQLEILGKDTELSEDPNPSPNVQDSGNASEVWVQSSVQQ